MIKLKGVSETIWNNLKLSETIRNYLKLSDTIPLIRKWGNYAEEKGIKLPQGQKVQCHFYDTVTLDWLKGLFYLYPLKKKAGFQTKQKNKYRGLQHTQKTYLMLLSIALRVREEERRKANEVIKSWQKEAFSLDLINTVFLHYLQLHQEKWNQSDYVPSSVFNTKMTCWSQL